METLAAPAREHGLTARCRQLQVLEMELLNQLSDFGLQAIVRGCPALRVLLVGGATQLSNISTQLIAQVARALPRPHSHTCHTFPLLQHAVCVCLY